MMVPKPPSASACRTSAVASSRAGRRSAKPVSVEPTKRDMRAHEGAGAAGALFALAVDDPRFGDEHAALAGNPAAFGASFSVTHRLGEMKVECCRQQEAVADQAVAGIESGVVQHLEIERAMGSARGVEAVGRDS